MTKHLFAFAVALTVFCATLVRADDLSAYIYQSTNPASPDFKDFPESSLIGSRPNAAIGFSGGGSRAYLAALGQLSALKQIGVLDNLRYIGGISGGAWATLMYSFAQNVDDITLLGPIAMPADLTTANLAEMPVGCARGFAAANLTEIALQALFHGQVSNVADSWSYAISQVYLEPVGITKDTRFSWSASTVDDIKKRNPSLQNEIFLIPTNPERAFPIVGTTLLGPAQGAPYTIDTHNYTRLEITPLYVGEMRGLNVDYKYTNSVENIVNHQNTVHTITVGGAMETFAFPRLGSPLDASQRLQPGQTKALASTPAPNSILDISHSAGAASFVPGSFASSSFAGWMSNGFSMTMNYVSPVAQSTDDTAPRKLRGLKKGDSTDSTMDWVFGDGGCYDNQPLISFLQRKVENIVIFFNPSTPLQPASVWDVAANPTASDMITDDLQAYFGTLPKENHFDQRNYENTKNQVFSSSDFVTVVQALQAAQMEGNGIMTTQTLTTVENSWWGIPAGFTTQVTFVYLGRLLNWEAQLTPDMYSLLVPSENAGNPAVDVDEGPFDKFPHYDTLGGLIDYQKGNVLSDLTGWGLLQHADALKAILGPQ